MKSLESELNEITFTLKRVGKPRYGENPQQEAILCEVEGSNLLSKGSTISQIKKLGGKDLSFNNYQDIDAVIRMLWQFDEPFAAVFKHTDPAGAAKGENIHEAYKDAWNGDPMSAFGGVAGVNRKVDEELAEYAIKDKFFEALVAPGYKESALDTLSTKENLRILEVDVEKPEEIDYDLRFLGDSVLAQEYDFSKPEPQDLIYLEDEGVRKPSTSEIEDMLFGWKIIRRARSNSVLLAKNSKVIGLGAGEQSRVNAAALACWKANKPYGNLPDPSEGETPEEAIGLDFEGRTEGSVAVSDAFYPFPDSIKLLDRFGVKGSLAPSGSIRDEKVYEALEECNMSGAHTPKVKKNDYIGGMRAFLH